MTYLETTLENDAEVPVLPSTEKVCPVCDITNAWMTITRRISGEKIFEHSYCIVCLDALLQKHLPLLKECEANG